MHAALDHLEEALGIHPGVPSRRQTGSHWIGFLCPMEDASVYGKNEERFVIAFNQLEKKY